MKGTGIFDDFLGAEASHDLLEFTIANEVGFGPSSISESAQGGIDTKVRRSSTFTGNWDGHRAHFRAAIMAATPQLLETTGVPEWSPKEMQIDLAIHRDGDFFRRHLDTLYGEHRKDVVRMVSAVYYVFREPKGFSGGELVITDPRGGAEEVIEPRHDRLVVFPSFLPHEVKPITVPGNAFADARFSVNCWLSRKRS
ncbi:2OG-Fe(II) oxygenase [Erythrobacter sp. GH1-10]|uniref:2OG-Fe(II) oxygenase n=1 Tax=Erythrobacter sp. GH1-10 TaxID=3349334 RepID=UPI003877BADC